MNFDLSIIDKVDDKQGGSGRKSSKFAPRARVRATAKQLPEKAAPTDGQQVPAPARPDTTTGRGNKETVQLESKPAPQNPEEASNLAPPSHPAEPCSTAGQDHAHSTREDLLQTAGPAQTDFAETIAERNGGGATSPVENGEEALKKLGPADSVSPRRRSQGGKSASPRKPNSTYELPARLKRKLRSQARQEEAKQSQAKQSSKAGLRAPAQDEIETGSRLEPDDSMAIVPVEEQQENAMELIQKKGKGAVRKRMDLETEAHMELDPGQDSIKKFVRRAMAQEKLKQAQAKKRKAEAIAAGLEDEEDDDRLAIQPAEETAINFAPQFELVDGKLVPKAQTLTVQAQAEPVHRRVKEYNNVVNNASYTNRMPNDRWTPEETEAFFNAVRVFGANFELISKLFPGRPRKALANKWRRESKLNPDRIEEAYTGKGSLDGLEKIVEAMQQTEATANGDVGDLGIQATDFFIPESDEPLAIEAANPVEQPKPVKRPRQTKKAALASTASQQQEGGEQPEEAAKPKSKRGRPKKSAPATQPVQKAKRGAKRKAAQSEDSDSGSEYELEEEAEQPRQRNRRNEPSTEQGAQPSEAGNEVENEEVGAQVGFTDLLRDAENTTDTPANVENARNAPCSGSQLPQEGNLDAADAEGALGLLQMAEGLPGESLSPTHEQPQAQMGSDKGASKPRGRPRKPKDAQKLAEEGPSTQPAKRGRGRPPKSAAVTVPASQS